MIKRIFAAIAAFAFFRSVTLRTPVMPLDDLDFRFGEDEFEIEPGEWFKDYIDDWVEAHAAGGGPAQVTSGIARGELSGDYIWITDTPEWDKKWFNARGWPFPTKWATYAALDNSVGEVGGPCYLRGL